MGLRQAIDGLLDHKLSSAPVVEQGRLVGMFSESDGLKGALDAGYHGADPGRVADYMTRELHTLSSLATVQEAAEIFLRHHRRCLPVVSGERLIGQLNRNDILRAAMASAEPPLPS